MLARVRARKEEVALLNAAPVPATSAVSMPRPDGLRERMLCRHAAAICMSAPLSRIFVVIFSSQATVP
jgi:hypothetical protein